MPIELREAIDQANFAATRGRYISAVHAVDDAGQHEAGCLRIKLLAVEQLEVELWPDADRLVGRPGPVPLHVSLEFLVERFADFDFGRALFLQIHRGEFLAP